MELKLYDTLTREKRVFTPIDPARVRMYVCGPTVYDFAHIGNARPVIVFDVLFRLLRHLYGESHVTYVRNITDVDDKINARAAERGVSIRQVTEETYKDFSEDVKALGCLPPTVEPRATEHIEAMKEIIEKLVKAGCAYVAEDHVLFNVSAMPDYGKLSRRSLDEMIAGARVEVAPYKKEPTDFVLWKPSKPGEPAWDSPAGIKTPGRPGWHIECSAMAWKHLGETFDIHGGGIDLVFPHHENEIAQSRCAFHTKVMANYWMHNGFLQVEGEKMAKSAGNFVTIRDLLSGNGRRPWPGEVIRLTMLATHYRQPLDFNEAKLLYWRTKLSQWAGHFKLFGSQEFDYKLWTGQADIFPSEAVAEALSDDLNAHEAFLYLDKLNQAAIKQDSSSADELGRNLIWLGLMRNAYADAYETNFFGAARPDLISKYGDAILDARAIVLNKYKFSKDGHERNASLAEVNHRINELHPGMKADSVRLVASEHAVVSLEPLSSESTIDKDRIESLIAERSAARKAKNFAESDRIRDELAAMGVVLKDSKEGTTWEIAR
jgi:cysteinyl-tRNA synthetase